MYNKTFRAARVLFMLAVALAVSSASHARKADGTLGLIRYPISNNPALVVPGGEIGLQLSSEASVSDVRVELYSKDAAVPIYTSASGESFKPVDRSTFGSPVEELPVDNWEMNWWWRPRVVLRDLIEVKIKLPDNVPEGFYGLRVKSSAGEDTSERAVRVFKEWPTKYQIIHMTDMHIGGKHIPDIEKVFLKVAKRVNQDKPAFVLNTGDCVDGAMPEQFTWFISALDQFNVPTFVVPGNHDAYGHIREGKTDLLKYYGDTYYSFDFGRDHYLGMDGASKKIDEEQMAWIEKDLASVEDGRFKCIFSHTIAYQDDAKWPWFLDLIGNNKVDLYVYGHFHTDLIEYLGPARTLSVLTSPSFSRNGYYNIITIEDGKVKSIKPSFG